MPNTTSAERRIRSSARKQARNHSTNSRLKTLERNYLGLIQAGKKEEAATAFREVSASLDKAAKRGIVHKRNANRKKSRLAVRLAPTK